MKDSVNDDLALNAQSSPYIAVIDDDADTRAMYCMVLEMENHTCFEFESGEAFLAFLQTNIPPLLILCDLFMPTMSGAELIKQLSADPRYDYTKVVLVSGAADISKYSQNLNCNVLLCKPVSVDMLVDTVSSQLASPKEQ